MVVAGAMEGAVVEMVEAVVAAEEGMVVVDPPSMLAQDFEYIQSQQPAMA